MPSSWLDFLPTLLKGAEITITVAFFSAILALIVAFAAGLCRLSKLWIVRTLTTIYVEIFRGTSLLVQLFWLYFALPFIGIELPKMLAAILAVGLNYGAYGSEIVRSAVLSVPKGQWEAATALNMKPGLRLWNVILPQASMQMLPPFGNQLVELIKSTSLVYFITMADLTYQAMVLRNNYISWTTEILILLLLMYFVITTLVSMGVRQLERKLTAGRL
ncbi:ectoine/hydroxyectoine ABC transporter permease subunit EhuC [Paenibacillus urinalis]|uniref:Ectoine/hydroxyectoine ABC transporter permease subunit EhuC n=1 Tax=Paenibacillus urinalis TaxID=521520 RepID=A0ABY7X6E5_9BACL|nr:MULTISPECIES: ectoine/hydroxyectoine ABC transporter permease subunit EhuC [Paenibacillus]WDH96652.1 ectoine/hydroxyectoine ABC transporter permease subunit EhuC [Paenibacillus urinalis]WDI00296.1 ectoine/hydroxyectoine ABC transporter permease subunit EhuC [Paenibacillus urinalis]GAK40806.1 amino acid ABC transporter permease protein [Paenibacillus sp. TCA20]